MNIKDFPNPKLNLPKGLRNSTDKGTISCFQSVEQYISLISGYIYTEINLDYQPADANHIHAWIQRIVSANLLRSLYIRNAFVEAINARNVVGMFLPLKAWFETVGVLASILDLLEKDLTPEEFVKKLQPYALGNKGKGKLRVGKYEAVYEAVNVATMMEKADKYMEKMTKESKAGSDVSAESFFTDFYDIASNPSHPSFDAQEMVGSLGDHGVWHAKSPEEVKNQIIESLPGYGGLLMAPVCIKNICQKILAIEKDHFARLNSLKYFD